MSDQEWWTSLDPDAVALIRQRFDPDDPQATSEGLYRRGAELWSGRRLEEATRLLHAAAAFAERDPMLGWGASIDRAAAQIALELDQPDLAAQHLSAFQVTPVSAFQHLAVYSRVLLLRGDADGAADAVSQGVALVIAVELADVGELMNTSIGLVQVADVLLELGYAVSARRLAELGDSLVARAGVTDPTVSSALALAAGRAAGMTGDAAAAARLLSKVDVALDPDLAVQVRAEEARVRWRDGDTEGARVAFDDAIAMARGAELRATVRLLSAERDETAPRKAREEPGPVETWAGDAAGRVVRPYAVVVSLVVEGGLDRYAELEDQVVELLARRPGLGEVDGIGTDGTVWELFLDGDDGPALWAAVEPLVRGLRPPAGSTLRLRIDAEDVVERPLQP